MPPRHTASVVAGVVVVLAGALAAAAGGGHWPVAVVLVLVEAARGVVGLGLLVSGVVVLVRSGRTDRAPTGLVGAGLVGAAAATPLLPPGGGDPGALARHDVGLVVHVVGFLVLAAPVRAACRAAQVDARVRPLRLTLGVAGAAVAVQVAALVWGLALPGAAVPAGYAVATHLLLATGGACVAVRLGRATTLDGDLNVAVRLLLVVGSLRCVLLAGVAALGWPLGGLLLVVAVGSDLVATMALCLVTVRGLLAVLRADAARERLVLDELVEHQRRDAADRARLHDARATLAGVRCAQDVLHGAVRGRPLRREEHGELARSVRAELERLERLLAPAAPAHAGHRQAGEDRRTCVDDVVRPVVVTMRERLATVRWAPSGCVVGIHPDDLATVVSTLLDNALVHAPGAAVEVVVEDVDAGTVRVVVRDDGPGVSPSLRGRLFAPGARGDASRGEGIGLAHARRLARSAGGELRLASPRDRQGATFVLDLPRAGGRRDGRRAGTARAGGPWG
ncbi:sensor histidine kinase [Aquipuribacter nitratireducens]|uniref:histidine kinase n=1 Tax=Aquipuribacter nitratireducens TaxID=650104 RepID=A0ABW0GSN2_9MICO